MLIFYLSAMKSESEKPAITLLSLIETQLFFYFFMLSHVTINLVFFHPCQSLVPFPEIENHPCRYINLFY
ncbi:hypothetical protein HA41_17005 [Pantoea conspicua]|uniref:Uncharacterized protein n=1 Tax=Pantoea conspicua TaxID=472705 RepID=A0A1X1BS39_9GAMM|nr:hypothetical protein HA41_17005 [Pantoea conspicua]